MHHISHIDWLRCALPTQKLEPKRLRHPFVQEYIRKALSFALQAPAFATKRLAQFFREQRSLGSKDRRRVQTAVFGLIRHQGIIERTGRWNPQEWPHVWADIAEGERFLALSATSPLQDYATALSLPVITTAEIMKRFTKEECLLLAQILNRPPPIYIRAQQISRSQLQYYFAKEDIQTEVCPKTEALILHQRCNLLASSLYHKGFFEIQDRSSQHFCMQIQSLGDSFFDICAGAGGKSLALAAQGKQVWAQDPRSHAIKELRKRAKRGGLKIQITAPPSPVDVVLIDAPCSGSGRLHRDPALRWRLNPKEHIETQKSLLQEAAQYVRSGGFLVYATCSIFDIENQHHLEGWKMIEEKQILPNDQDGFYWNIRQRIT